MGIMQEGAELHILPRFLLEMNPLPWTVFTFANVVFCQSVIDLGGDIVIEGIRLLNTSRPSFGSSR